MLHNSKVSQYTIIMSFSSRVSPSTQYHAQDKKRDQEEDQRKKRQG